jgi:hypothetical protein
MKAVSIVIAVAAAGLMWDSVDGLLRLDGASAMAWELQDWGAGEYVYVARVAGTRRIGFVVNLVNGNDGMGNVGLWGCTEPRSVGFSNGSSDVGGGLIGSGGPQGVMGIQGAGMIGIWFELARSGAGVCYPWVGTVWGRPVDRDEIVLQIGADAGVTAGLCGLCFGLEILFGISIYILDVWRQRQPEKGTLYSGRPQYARVRGSLLEE